MIHYTVYRGVAIAVDFWRDGRVARIYVGHEIDIMPLLSPDQVLEVSLLVKAEIRRSYDL